MHWTRCLAFEPKVVFRGTWSSLECLWERVVLLFWHAPLPLGVHSAIRTGRHQPPQRTVLGQVDCFIQCEIVGSQITLDGVQPCDTRTPWWSLPVVWWGAVRIILASASSSIHATCPNMERCHDWIITVRLGCLVILLTLSLRILKR